MKSFRILLFVTVLMVIGYHSNGQLMRDLHKLYHPAYFQQGSTDTTKFEPWLLSNRSKPIYSVEVGSSFSTFGGGISSSYISPMVSFMATDKLQIVAGGKFSYTNANSIPFFRNESLGQSAAGNPTEAFAYGRYQVNQKLSVYGVGAFGKNQLYFSPFQSGLSTTDYQYLSFGADYKLSDKVKFGVSFGFTNGPAWGNSPFSEFGSQRANPFFP